MFLNTFSAQSALNKGFAALLKNMLIYRNGR